MDFTWLILVVSDDGMKHEFESMTYIVESNRIVMEVTIISWKGDF